MGILSIFRTMTHTIRGRLHGKTVGRVWERIEGGCTLQVPVQANSL
jgi:hypothetical protein